jgi:hypothetical protein
LFSLIGAMIGIFISIDSVNDDYRYFYIYSSFSGFLTAYVTSRIIIEKKGDFNHVRLLAVSLFVGLFSHWVCWYLIAIEMNFRFWVLGEYFMDEPISLIDELYMVFTLCIWSWAFFGIPTIIGSSLTIFTARTAKKKFEIKTTHNNGEHS